MAAGDTYVRFADAQVVREKACFHKPYPAGVLYSCQGMLEGNNYRRWVRSFVAVGLGVLFVLASLTPLTAGALTTVSRCASKTKCCCRKAHGTDGPAISSRSCQTECGRITLGGTGVTVYAQPRTGSTSPVIALADSVLPTEFLAHLLCTAGSHRQRPPPSLLPA